MRLFTLVLALVPLPAALADKTELLDFNRDIRPILSAKCFSCHGPDEQDRDADLRLDTEEGALADLGGYAAIVRGKPDDSELVVRITAEDEGDLMPPPKHKNPLTAEEIELLTRWIDEGAPYAGHWAFEPVVRPELPMVGEAHAIDQFIGARLADAGLAFSSEAPPETLIRRLHLDLTGLPPSPQEVDSFLADPVAQYEATIDRLMLSPHFAERLAQEWLDVARFADTNGYSIDDHRDMWVWRDWVIQAFQENLPYDKFIRVQLAGDLLREPNEPQLIATGFLRNAMNTHEGGTIAEEYRVARIADQIDTVSTAFLGLTVKCAQCHDHKYDAISQRDYFRMFAFFNTTSEGGKGAKNGNTKPFVEVSPLLQDQAAFQRAIKNRIASLEEIKTAPSPFLDTPLDASEIEDNADRFPFPKDGEAEGLSWIWTAPDGPRAVAWFRKSFQIDSVPKKAQLFISCDNEAVVWLNGHRVGEAPDWRTPAVIDLRPHLKAGDNLLAIQGTNWEGNEDYAGLLALVAFADGTYIPSDRSWVAGSKKDGDWLKPTGGGGFAPATLVAKHGDAPWGNTLQRLYPKAGEYPKNPDLGKLVKAIDGEIGLLRKSLQSGKTTVMVMDSGALDRRTHILDRGAYDAPGEIVEAGIPAVFGSLPEGDGIADRLALAEWLIDPSNPLTARVTVNRYWQMLFGTGLVKTAEDFGSQGEWPSHPQLLDWLASEFVLSDWDVQALIKTMLLTRTYRQSSDATPGLLESDPYNRLLARAPRYRLSAESVRDNALVVGGLIDREIGGPSVYPPQPKGLWKEVSHFGYPGFFSSQHFFPDRGKPALRRSLYTFWKRTSPPPVMAAFDAPSRETCAVRRSVTNTPMQALTLMNEPQFVEAAHGLAVRMMAVAGELPGQISSGFRLATSRHPSEQELAVLESAYVRQLGYFREAPERANDYLGDVDKASPALAAMSSVASLILNLDETITRE